MTTDHAEFSQWDASYVLGSLTPEDHRAYEAHLEECERCRAAVAELLALQEEYIAWLDGLPASLHGGATAEALQAVADLDLEALAAIEPPGGYGRD